MKARMITVFLVAALAGCASPQQRAERMIAHYGPACDALGFERASDGWRNCVLQGDAAHIQRAQAAIAIQGNMQRSMRPQP